MKKRVVFVDIDTQYDFMHPHGKLYVPGAEKLKPNLKRLFKFAKESNIVIIASVDSHKRDDPEFKAFPPHCITGSRGHKKIKETLLITKTGTVQQRASGQVLVTKHTIDIFSNPRMKVLLRPYGTAYVFGVALDYCVKAACLGLVNSGIQTYLIKDATRAVSAKGKTETLRLLKRKGVSLVTTDAVINRLQGLKWQR